MYALIGEKLSHSYSKEIHTRCGLNYSLCEVEKDKLKDFLDNNSYLGFNVTIPYKKDIIPLLDYVDEHAKKIGAVNTVKKVNGKFYGKEKLPVIKSLKLKTKIPAGIVAKIRYPISFENGFFSNPKSSFL